MFLHHCRITRTLPCLADPEKIRVIAELSDEIPEVFPYINAIVKGGIYNHPAITLTFRKGEALITLHVRHITVAKVEDEAEAEKLLTWLTTLINETYEKRGTIEPDFSGGSEVRALDLFKFLPRSNCGTCGEPTCLAFAVKLVTREIDILRCAPLFAPEHQEKRNALLEILQAAGHPFPSESSSGSSRG